MEERYKLGENIWYNAAGGTLSAPGKTVDLTAQANRLLRYFVLNAGQTLTKEQILEHVWGYDTDSDGSKLIYDAVSAVRRLLKEVGLKNCITTKPDIGYVFMGSAQSESVSVPPAFTENAAWTLDTVYLLLMGDSTYKKAWFLKTVGDLQKIPPLCLEPGSPDPLAEDAFFRRLLPDDVWTCITENCPKEKDRMALYDGEASPALLSALRRDFQNDSGWRGRALAQNCRIQLESALIPSVAEATLGAALQNSPQLCTLYRLWQVCIDENRLPGGLALVVLYALLGAQNFKILAETQDLPAMLKENF